MPRLVSSDADRDSAVRLSCEEVTCTTPAPGAAVTARAICCTAARITADDRSLMSLLALASASMSIERNDVTP